MIHIVKVKGGFMNVLLGQRRKVLLTSEILESKNNAILNALSVAKIMWADDLFSAELGMKPANTNYSVCFYQDDTLEIPKIIKAVFKDNKILKKEVNEDIIKKLKIKVVKYNKAK
jgi:hypothetical protein